MPIQVLPPQLANQIAAGEVVERPASVVKELVENSIDAGATRIDIDIERGGAKLIRIRDNGCGIKKDELALALARHATSKIASLDDLEAIISLGFRGEALASISSVSRLTLTSRTAEQQEAWQAYAEGRDMDVTVKPAAHPVGTTLEVLDLFYNTPARRKFMRTEKTEFGHIDEVVRRIALARFDVTINLSHNGKMMRQYRAVTQNGQKERRLGAICGTAFLEQSHIYPNVENAALPSPSASSPWCAATRRRSSARRQKTARINDADPRRTPRSLDEYARQGFSDAARRHLLHPVEAHQALLHLPCGWHPLQCRPHRSQDGRHHYLRHRAAFRYRAGGPAARHPL
mgnify:CR=1 FL=1